MYGLMIHSGLKTSADVALPLAAAYPKSESSAELKKTGKN
jgi:hypothetical protein